jgi:uncharacterized surface protein with fasciclin (FAS1) repeats
MKKLFRMATLAVCGAMMIASCTDTWDDHYGDAGTGTNGSTMDYLTTHASDFAEILKAAGFDANLNSSQVFTILAPKNGSFDKKALLTQLASGDKSQVVERFIKNHVMLYSVSMNDEEKMSICSTRRKFTSEHWQKWRLKACPSKKPTSNVATESSTFYLMT